MLVVERALRLAAWEGGLNLSGCSSTVGFDESFDAWAGRDTWRKRVERGIDGVSW